jgi:hypothetical protein
MMMMMMIRNLPVLLYGCYCVRRCSTRRIFVSYINICLLSNFVYPTSDLKVCCSCFFSFTPFTSYQCLAAVFFCLLLIYLTKLSVEIFTFLWVCDYTRYGLLNGFIDHLYAPLGTTLYRSLTYTD